MKKQPRLIAALLLLLLNIVTLSLTTAQSGAPERRAYHPQTGKVSYIGASAAQPIIVPQAAARDMTPTARAQALLDVYAADFGVKSQELTFSREFGTGSGILSRRYQQTYQGIPVFAGELVVNMTPNGGLVSMLGEASPDLMISTVPVLASADAQALALLKAQKDFGVTTLSASAPALWIYDERLIHNSAAQPTLVWRVEVVSTVGAPIKATALVDAMNGKMRLFYNQIDAHPISNSIMSAYQTQIALPGTSTEVTRATSDLATYDATGTNLPGVLACDETQQPCTTAEEADEALDSIHRFAQGTYDLYFQWHGRDSYNNNGYQIISSGHVDVNFCNAFFTGTQTAYGDGCNGLWRDDVVAHEMTHGVTQFTSALIYYSESGAINESFSDVWGEFYDLTNNSAEDTPKNRWRVGEETDFSQFGLTRRGIRDLQDPTIFGHPDRMKSPLFYNGPEDNGGVHYNSGVNNKAVYLMVDGDTFNGYTITPIGIRKTAAIYYDTQTTKLTPGSAFSDLANALEQSCIELTGGADGITAADCVSVQNALLATEMRKPPAAVADVCEAGSAFMLFEDGLESGGGNWTVGYTAGTQDAWMIASAINPLNGAASNYGDNLDRVNASFAAMTADVTLPANAHLHFTHRFKFEGSTYFYDGGAVEYSTDGGATWLPLTSEGFYQEGLDYGGKISTGFGNPLKGREAFVGISNGIGATRYGLNSLAGQNIRFRWVIGTDGLIGDDGWHVDDVKIYTCSEQPPTPSPAVELLENGTFENSLVGWTVKNGSGDKVRCNKATKIVARTGECAFSFTGSVGEGSSLIQAVDLTGLTPAAGDRIDVRAFIKAENALSGVTLKVRVKYTDGTSAGKLTKAVILNGEYTETTDSYTLLSANISKVKIQIENQSTAGKVYLDDISLLYTDGSGAGLLPLP